VVFVDFVFKLLPAANNSYMSCVIHKFTRFRVTINGWCPLAGPPARSTSLTVV